MDMHGLLNRTDYLVVAGYIILLLGLGFWVSIRKKHTRDIFLAERDLRWPQIGFSMFGINVSPTMMIGFCGIGYSAGMVAANFEWLAWIFLMLLAMVFAPHYLGARVSTMPQFIERRFGKRCHAFLSWYALLCTLLLWLSGALYAGSLLLGQIMGWNLWVSVIILTLISTSFTVAGGLSAVAVANTFQSLIMIVISAVLVIIAFTRIGGFENLTEGVPAGYWKLLRQAGDTNYPWYAILLGYPTQAVWFWCTDQTIVQLVLGARNIRQGQYGAVFLGYLKIIAPFLFIVPGILCVVLFPGLVDQDLAYMTMVTSLFPHGLIGLVVVILIAALVSTINSGLNSFGTILTLDIYEKKIRPNASEKEVIWVGRAAILVAALIAVICALGLGRLGRSLFDVITGIIAFLAPPMTAVFLVAVIWKRATASAALTTFIAGSIASLVIGVLSLSNTPQGFWPHYLLLSFYLAGGLIVLMVTISLLGRVPAKSYHLPSINRIYDKLGYSARPVRVWWIILAFVMLALYLFFQLSGSSG
jgi:SSS family solute:Na+ symporter